MASPIMCNGPDGGPAVVMVTMLADGDTVGLCAPCLTDWCHALIKATAPELLAEASKPAAARPRRKRVTAVPLDVAAGIDPLAIPANRIGDEVADGEHAADTGVMHGPLPELPDKWAGENAAT